MFLCIGRAKHRVCVKNDTVPEAYQSVALGPFRDGQRLWLEIDSGRYVGLYNESELALACRVAAEYARALAETRVNDQAWFQQTARIWENAAQSPVLLFPELPDSAAHDVTLLREPSMLVPIVEDPVPGAP